MKKVKGLRRANWQVQSCHGAVKYSRGSTVSNIVVSMYDTVWVLEIPGEHFVKYVIANHYAVHVKLTQNNTECILYLKKNFN